mmetsp:Transcript_5760/g.15672  ORF Transcript_5760/g.15672 Transcript_5760/m.15672 type:complete len:319 (-) Transcript_5760:878-1834(-)
MAVVDDVGEIAVARCPTPPRDTVGKLIHVPVLDTLPGGTGHTLPPFAKVALRVFIVGAHLSYPAQGPLGVVPEAANSRERTRKPPGQAEADEPNAGEKGDDLESPLPTLFVYVAGEHHADKQSGHEAPGMRRMRDVRRVSLDAGDIAGCLDTYDGGKHDDHRISEFLLPPVQDQVRKVHAKQRVASARRPIRLRVRVKEHPSKTATNDPDRVHDSGQPRAMKAFQRHPQEHEHETIAANVPKTSVGKLVRHNPPQDASLEALIAIAVALQHRPARESSLEAAHGPEEAAECPGLLLGEHPVPGALVTPARSDILWHRR